MDRASQDSQWRNWRAKRGPLLISFLLLTLLLFYLYFAVVSVTGGHYGYPMDDTYIHMAMAKSFSQYGVWGLTRYAFSSTSSSLLFTFLLSAVYFVAGVSDLAPLAINVVLAFVLLYLCDWICRQESVSNWPRLLLLTLIIFGMPLAPETMAGMEHPLHTILAIAMGYGSIRLLLNRMPSNFERYLVLCLAALVVLARYEALAMVLAIAVCFFLRGRRWYAIGLLAASVIPIALFGAYSISKGWYPVPNSIIAKASRPEKSGLPYPIHWIEQLFLTPSVAFLLSAGVILAILVYREKRTLWNVQGLSLSIFIPTALLHMQFARVGWFYRYEAYLVVFGLLACGLALSTLSVLSRPVIYGIFLIGAALSCESRAVGSLWLTPWACRNIHEQQYQMGRFLQQHYGGVSVVMNDIGAAGYLSDAKIVDLYGLASIEVTRAKIHHQFTQEFRQKLAEQSDSKIAIVYPGMYKDVGGLPPQWTPVGSWTIQQNQICWGDTVTFYAIDPTYRQRLAADLRTFGPKLPTDVSQSGTYIRPDKTN